MEIGEGVIHTKHFYFILQGQILIRIDDCTNSQNITNSSFLCPVFVLDSYMSQDLLFSLYDRKSTYNEHEYLNVLCERQTATAQFLTAFF